MAQITSYQPDRRRSWLIGGFAVVVAFFSLVLLAAAIGSDAELGLLGFDVPPVTWMVVWGLMAAVAGGAAVRSFRAAFDRAPALVLDDIGLTYRLEITGRRFIRWDQVGSVVVKQINRSVRAVRVHLVDGGRMDVRPDLLVGATLEGLCGDISGARDEFGSPNPLNGAG